ncbi:NAD(P)H-dependent flavin oxidoreductase [Salinarimonas soli]|uniref:Nitronate monooxygenase n=1 Tax=Salinarimonas soli TaxID=1638099 RepID=A0A5B2VIQ3_9HYPH|nr:nitronate monooxygenase family protein [Salinarimonas soli]KAA2238252.1 nitronate monooxygenase [Salinarimonas soli]
MPVRDRDHLLRLLGIELPIIQAPMAGAATPEMVIAVSEAGGLGSLPGALYTPPELRAALDRVRAGTRRSFNLNFFCHVPPPEDPARQAAWRERLRPYYAQAGLDPDRPAPPSGRTPFDEAACAIVEEVRPRVVSFHFGLPEDGLLRRVKATGAVVLGCATNVAEARWLVERGVDAVIAMGAEAGGHRGAFLDLDISRQIGTFALVPQVADAVPVPVIAAGGIADRRGVEAAFVLGASAAQVGTAFLLTPEAKIPAVHRAALQEPDRPTALTNLLTGRPARSIVNRLMAELGPLSDDAPAFPTAGTALGPIRAAAEAAGRDDFTNLWAGQAFPLASPLSAADLTRRLAGVEG